mmetsp:Transcript_34323/g.80302  ORF Transcript_34323/g.80302 Transcript_34323/m.80302 type:complete len:206 (-) Transcript_34323:33-650(-)
MPEAQSKLCAVPCHQQHFLTAGSGRWQRRRDLLPSAAQRTAQASAPRGTCPNHHHLRREGRSSRPASHGPPPRRWSSSPPRGGAAQSAAATAASAPHLPQSRCRKPPPRAEKAQVHDSSRAAVHHPGNHRRKRMTRPQTAPVHSAQTQTRMQTSRSRHLLLLRSMLARCHLTPPPMLPRAGPCCMAVAAGQQRNASGAARTAVTE